MTGHPDAGSGPAAPKAAGTGVPPDRRANRDSLIATACVAFALVVLRSAVFVAYEGVNFDSDQAVFGLMAKHLAELRAFPLFSYAQSYMLAVTTWVAAPVVALLGPTVFALKLPVLGVNLACGVLLVARLTRDTGLRPSSALVAALPFLMPPVITTALLTQHAGGNVEPFLYILLLWLLRRRPVAFGLVAGIGFLQREFTAYGVTALLAILVLQGRLRHRGQWGFWLRAAAAFGTVLATVEALRPFATYPGTRGTGIGWKGAGPAFDRLSTLVERTLPLLYGLRPMPVRELNVCSRLTEGWAAPLLAPVLATIAVVLGLRLVRCIWRERRFDTQHELPLYLALVGAQCLVAYVLLGRGAGADAYLRYVLLALFLPVAGLAWVARAEPSAWARRSAAAAAIIWATANAVDHGRLAAEYVLEPPIDPRRILADDLVARGIRYGAADYWTAYHVSYLAREQVKLHARGFKRIDEYRTLFVDNLATAVDVRASGPCADGREVAGFCVVGPPAPRWRVNRSADADPEP